jgi:hypothetical protein
VRIITNFVLIFRNQSHGGPLQLHSIRSSSSSHHNIPPLESVEPSDVNYHSSRGGNRDGNRSEQPYSMYVYQQWAKLNPEAAANVDPSTAADLLTRAVKVQHLFILNKHQSNIYVIFQYIYTPNKIKFN